MDITALISKISNKRFLVAGLICLVLLILLAVLPLYAPGYWLIRLTSILMYIILTVGWVMFSGPTGYMSLATAAFFGVGMYTAAFLGNDVPMVVFVILGGLVSSILALGVGALTLRLRGIYFAIFTFGLVMLISQLLMYWELWVTGTRGRFVIVLEHDTIYYVMLVIFVVLMFTVYFIRRSKFGLALQSIGQNEEAAAHTGVNVTMVKIVIFAISAFFMGAAGAIWATKLYYVDPGIAFNPFFSFMPVLMAIFGGMGQLYGPVIGATFFTLLKEYLITSLAKWGLGELYMLFFGIILVVAILFMPNGVVGVIQSVIRKLRRGGSAVQNANT